MHFLPQISDHEPFADLYLLYDIRVASKLADKPDQDQINSMLNDLEAAVSKRLGNDNTFEGLLDSMKSGKRTIVIFQGIS